MTLTEYSNLKHLIVSSAVRSDKHSQILSILKDYYKEEIDSPRRYEKIITIGQLLRILEIRNVLSDDNLGPLKEVASRLPNSKELLQKISEYESSHTPKEDINYYDTEKTQESPNLEPFDTFNSHPCGNISGIKKRRIYETIIEEIGSYWRDLARNLNIQEYKIDDIDNIYNTLSEKASQVLEFYEHKKADPQKWFFVLCEALEKSRRKDISRSIQDVMTMSI